LVNALSSYQSAPQTATAITTATNELEGRINSSLALQTSALNGKADAGVMTSLQSTINLHTVQLEGKTSTADLSAAIAGLAIQARLTVLLRWL
jgi:hypothetical protein